MLEFERTASGFNFVFEQKLNKNETVIVKMPSVSPNKKGINDIGWQADGEVTLYGTLSRNPEGSTAIWQEIASNSEVNKTISAIKIVGGPSVCNVIIRVILD